MGIHTAKIAAALVLFTAATCAAKPLTPGQALARVKGINSSESRSTEQAMTLSHTEKVNGKATVYLFSDPQGGFMLVSADDCAKPLLGYGDKYDAATKSIPENVKWWMGVYGAQINAASTSRSTTYNESDTDASADSLDEIEPLLTTYWGQESPFNSYCPLIGTTRAPSGCVATAISQCMYYYKWPEHGRGSTSYKSTYGGTTHNLALDFDTVMLDWDNMVPNYNLAHTYDQASAVATLMYSVGVGVHMQYNLTGSGSDYMTAASAMIKYFDYAESVCYYEREYYELDRWISKIHRELAAGRPVPYSGSNNVEGHAFVADGYKHGGYFHINWGWSGELNGWFQLSALDPHQNDLRSNDGGYDMGQAIITGFVPSNQNMEPAIELRVSGNFSAQEGSYTRNQYGNVTFHCQNGIFSMAYATNTVTLGVKLTDGDGNVSYLPSSVPHTFSQFSATQNYTVPMHEFPTIGNFLVEPAFRDSVGMWHPILIPLTNERSVELTANDSILQFVKSDEIPNLTATAPEATSTFMVGERFSATSTLTNTGTEFYDEVWPLLIQNGTIVAHGPAINVDVPENSSLDVEWVGSFTALSGKTLSAGTYQLVVANAVNYSYVKISPETTVQIRAKTAAPLFYTSTAVNIDGKLGESTSPTAPVSISSPQTTFTFVVNCTQGFFGQNVGVYVFDADADADSTTPAFQFGDTFVGITSDQSKSLDIEADLSELAAGTVYRAEPWASTSGRLSETPAYFRIGTTGVEYIDYVSLPVSCQVFSISGQYLGNSVNSLGSGLYIVKKYMSDGKIQIEKIVKR